MSRLNCFLRASAVLLLIGFPADFSLAQLPVPGPLQPSGAQPGKPAVLPKAVVGNGKKYQKPYDGVSKFMRLVDKEGNETFLGNKRPPVALQFAKTVYRPADGSNLTVTLYPVTHIADKAFYAWLQKSLDKHEKVLFEGVGPRGGRKPKPKEADEGGSIGIPLDEIYQLVADHMGLATQKSQLSFADRKRYEHADLDLVDLKMRAEMRGETKFTVLAQTFLDLYKKGNVGEARGGADQPPDLPALLDSPEEMRMLFVKQFTQTGGDGTGLTAIDPYLIDARNKECLRTMTLLLDFDHNDFALPWGAAHCPDFERRLVMEWKLVKDEKATEWVTGWDLTKPIPKSNNSIEERLQQMLLQKLIGGAGK